MQSDSSKVCAKCGEEQPLAAFEVIKTGHRAACAECLLNLRREWHRRWVDEHPEKVKEHSARSRDNRREVLRVYQNTPERRRQIAEWAQAHPEALRAADRRWSAKNPEKIADKARRRRALRRTAFVERVEMSVLVDRDRGMCGVCGAKVRPEDRSGDHILPLSKGGAHSYANTRLVHLGCNSKRRNTGPAQLRMLG